MESDSVCSSSARAGEDWLTVAQAAEAGGVAVRTVRRWVAEGRVESRVARIDYHDVRLIRRGTLPVSDTEPALVSDGHGPSPGSSHTPSVLDSDGQRVTGSANPAPSSPQVTDDQPLVASSVTPGPVTDTDSAIALQGRLEGAHLAAKIQATRFREERERLVAVEERARERERELRAEIEFLRERLVATEEQARTQVQARVDETRELRLLLAGMTQAMQGLERPALPAATVERVEPPKDRVRWWRLWARE
jgi:hypothetical protein